MSENKKQNNNNGKTIAEVIETNNRLNISLKSMQLFLQL